ncbi:fimbrial subunit FimA [Bifidobacterium margollesii]|uniref:Fimbrial subunit FimA n=1 Tax=Bifidobacterium margollesii TaxID=2020964 RepID=A0A2N5J7K8_9BIFI|nr:SpaH/EbpB family LPXTG-anchored major pilin [Bifidobacterium margollesii]PLS30208.1 fimbrial subunit FimA [Bifidobacterium margollesii]
MKLRKLFAGVAAAATLLGGMALGVGTANAAETITLNAGEHGVVQGHTFKVVELAKYLTANTGEVQTVADRDTVVKAIKTATGKDVPANVDPMVWAQSGDLNGTGNPLFGDNSAFPWGSDAASRNFANALVSYVETNGAEATADAEPYELSVPEAGLYLIVDTTADATATQKSLPIIVGTANTALGMTGQIEVKNQKTNVPPKKTVTGDNDGTVSVGDALHYAIEGAVPSTTDQDAEYTYVFNDYASAGLSIDTHKTNVKVYAGDNATEALADAEYTVSPADRTVTGNGKDITFSVSLTKAALDKLQNVAGQKLTVKYDATVTDDAKTNPVTNSAEVSNGGNTSGTSTPVILHSNSFEFTKQWADGSTTGLDKAVFSLTDANGKTITASPDAKTGKVSFSGLENGTYTVIETTVAEGAQNVTGRFTVTLTYNEQTKATDVKFADTPASDPYDLVKFADNGTKATVTNVKSLTQLPLTGAAGVGMFLVLAAVLGGAAVTTYTKSRRASAALRA